MKTFLRLAPACAVTSLLVLASPVWAQGGADDTGSPGNGGAAPSNGADTQGAAPSATSPSAMPGVVLERNVFVPVDKSGHPTSNQFIVVERRELQPKGQSADGSGSGDASDGAVPDVTTRFILVPQDSDDNDNESGSGSGDDSGQAAPQ